jgi:hypothetical protein
MNNYYYSKKYKKYVGKNMSGGTLTYADIVRYNDLINSDLGRIWCYTGSIALYLYCKICAISNSLVPNDIDIVYVPDFCFGVKPLNIAGFMRNPDILSDNGLPYYDHHGKKMLDLMCEEEISYYEAKINDDIFRLLSPEKLLNEYINRLEDLDEPDSTIENKIELLRQVVLYIDKTAIKIYRKPSEKLSETFGEDIPQPNFFDDDDD